MRLSELIRQYRLEHGLSQRQFAAKCDRITNGYISMLENEANPHTGKPSTPSLEKLSAIARGMGLTLSELERAEDELGALIAAEKRKIPDVTPEMMRFYFEQFRKGEVDDPAYRRLLIDTFLRAVYVHPDHLDITFSFEDGTDRPPARVELGDGVCIEAPGGHQMQLIQTLARVGRVFVISVNRPR